MVVSFFLLSLSLLSSSTRSGGSDIGLPKGFSLTNDAVTEGTWSILRHWIETDLLETERTPIPWQMGAQNRQVAQFGFQYDYSNDVVDTTTPTPPIPPKLKELLQVEEKYSQCIINCYEPNILIPWHKDDLRFGPTVSVYTFGEARPLLLRLEGDRDHCQALPQHCSKYVLSNSARYDWEHMVPKGSDFRVSFTFRTHRDAEAS